MKLVTLYHGANPADTQLVFSRLEAANFHPFIPDENSMFTMEGYGPAIGLYRLQVPEDEFADAKEFLEAPGE
jgi:hypothetical protein